MNLVRAVRILGIVEGCSWLLLLFVAMPLKYGLDMPIAVRWVGSVHGLLFTVFVLALLIAHFSARWTVGFTGKVFGASLLPFGFLLVDEALRRREDPLLA